MIFDERIVMNTFHLSLDVPDLDRAVAFYEQLFGQEPAKRKPGYAKFELADPPVALALQQAGRPALSHLGIRVDTTDEVEGASTRLKQSGLVTLEERDTACCYARQDKVWVRIPPETAGRSTPCSTTSTMTTSTTTVHGRGLLHTHRRRGHLMLRLAPHRSPRRSPTPPIPRR